MATTIAAFDLGAESGRLVLGTLDGGRLTLHERHRFANPMAFMLGRLQWNLAAQWEEMKAGLRAVAKESDGGAKLASIGVDTWGVDFGLLSTSGEILGDPTMYRDSATNGVIERACEKIGRRRIFQATGVQFSRINSLYQLMAMKERDSAILRSAEKLLFMPDLFHYLLCGSTVNEISIASTSQMFDTQQGRWATEMLEQLGLSAKILQKVVPSGTVLGELNRAVAAECGIARMLIIAPGGHDTASAVAAVPADASLAEGTWCYISSGTWSLLGVELDRPIVTDQAMDYGYANELGVSGKVRFLKNIMGLWLVQECRRQWRREGLDHDYATLTAMAGEAPPLGSLVDPDDESFFEPANMVEKIEQFCRKTEQRGPDGIGPCVRTCLESLALSYRRTIEGLEEILGRRIVVIHIVGGGSRNGLLNQMTADACGRPVIAGPVEATAVGNVLVQATALGQVSSLSQARAIVRESFEGKHYDPGGGAEWDSAYRRYREIVGK